MIISCILLCPPHRPKQSTLFSTPYRFTVCYIVFHSLRPAESLDLYSGHYIYIISCHRESLTTQQRHCNDSTLNGDQNEVPCGRLVSSASSSILGIATSQDSSNQSDRCEGHWNQIDKKHEEKDELVVTNHEVSPSATLSRYVFHYLDPALNSCEATHEILVV